MSEIDSPPLPITDLEEFLRLLSREHPETCSGAHYDLCSSGVGNSSYRLVYKPSQTLPKKKSNASGEIRSHDHPINSTDN